VPTIAEAGYPHFKAEVYYVIAAPIHISEPIAKRLEGEVRNALTSPDFQERFRPQNIEIAATNGVEAKARIEADTKQWSTVVKATGMHVP
jgi:tripartite-type tricarboxylate transporter receptor subunit TctC